MAIQLNGCFVATLLLTNARCHCEGGLPIPAIHEDFPAGWPRRCAPRHDNAGKFIAPITERLGVRASSRNDKIEIEVLQCMVLSDCEISGLEALETLG